MAVPGPAWEPAVEMAGFESAFPLAAEAAQAYFATVPRSQSSSRAILR